MILRSLTLEDFRQFAGRQHLEFSTDPKRNVTLIYGSNGAGKTTILNALTWGLYGKTTPGLKSPEYLINEIAWASAQPGDEVTARIVLEFDDGGKRFTMERRVSARKPADGSARAAENEEATLHVTDATGRNEQGAPEGTINAILPERLHRFVFFDGERDIERLARDDAYEEIEDAIKTVLGLEVIERAIEDASAAQKILNKDLREAGSPEHEKLAARIEAKETTIAERREERDLAKRNLSARSTQLEKVDEELARHAEARELQQQRAEFEEREAAAERRVSQAHDDLAESIDRDGYTAFVSALAKSVIESYDDKRRKKEIPRGIARQFVEDLLVEGECICGTELIEGSRAQEHVQTWVEKAGDSDVENQWQLMSAAAKDLFRRRSDHFSYLHQTITELDAAAKDRAFWQDKASEITDRVKHLGSEEIQRLERRRDELIAAREDDRRRIWECERDLEHLEQELRDAVKELDEARALSEKAERARRRVAATRSACSIFERILALRTAEERQEIDRRLKDVFRRICFKPYAPELTPDFHLTLSKMVGGDARPVGWSSGEGQILSLSFVGAIAERARAQFEAAEESKKRNRGLLSFEGGIFPLVLDAVFGVLDERYQQHAAEALTELAPQLIVIASAGQGAAAIREKLWPKAGKIVVSVAHTSKEDEQAIDIELPNGAKHPYVVVGAEYDHSTLEEAV